MTYGYSSGTGNSYGSHKAALNNDAGASERLRIEAAKKAREKQEKDKAKMELADLGRKLEHARLELSSHRTEVRRIESEFAHDSRFVQDLERDLVLLLKKEHDLKAHSSDADQAIQKLDKEGLEKRKASDDIGHELQRLESEMQKLLQQVNQKKKEIYDIGVEIQKLGLASRQAQMAKHKQALDASRISSERSYKEKDVDNKRRALMFLQQKKEHELHEESRLQADIIKLEMEIKTLELKTK